MRRFVWISLVSLVVFLPGAARTAPPQTVNDGYGDYVYVPAGAFRMGDNFGDGEARERPVHAVELDAFYIAKFEMTNGEWKKFRDDPGYDDPKFWPNGYVVPKNQVPYWTQPNNHGGGTPDSDTYPLLGVNWDSATAYCELAQREDREEVPAADRGRVGEGRARYGSAQVSVGQRDRSLVREFRRRAGVRHRPAARFLRRHEARRSADAQQRLAVRRLRHGRQRHGVVPGLVRQGLLRRRRLARIRKVPTRAPIASSAAAPFSWKRSTCAPTRARPRGPHFRATG